MAIYSTIVVFVYQRVIMYTHIFHLSTVLSKLIKEEGSSRMHVFNSEQSNIEVFIAYCKRKITLTGNHTMPSRATSEHTHTHAYTHQLCFQWSYSPSQKNQVNSQPPSCSHRKYRAHDDCSLLQAQPFLSVPVAMDLQTLHLWNGTIPLIPLVMVGFISESYYWSNTPLKKKAILIGVYKINKWILITLGPKRFPDGQRACLITRLAGVYGREKALVHEGYKPTNVTGGHLCTKRQSTSAFLWFVLSSFPHPRSSLVIGHPCS